MNAGRLEKLKALLIGKKLKIAVAESLTCGRLQAALGSISGASDFFEGGITAYNLKQKTRLLAVDKQYAKSVNSISQQVAFELAAGACRLFQTDIGLGTTGYAEPSPENDVAEPMAYLAICRCIDGKIQKITGKQVQGAGFSRVEMQEHVSTMALETLLTYLENFEPVE